jgi:hypothetical protein
MTSKWIQLKRGDDWGTIYYCFNPLTKHGTADHNLGWMFASTQHVKFPTGTERRAHLVSVTSYRTIYDMGHEYKIQQTELHVQIPIFGLVTTFEISTPGLLIDENGVIW